VISCNQSLDACLLRHAANRHVPRELSLVFRPRYVKHAESLLFGFLGNSSLELVFGGDCGRSVFKDLCSLLRVFLVPSMAPLPA
jgi:hypothetical protein